MSTENQTQSGKKGGVKTIGIILLVAIILVQIGRAHV